MLCGFIVLSLLLAADAFPRESANLESTTMENHGSRDILFVDEEGSAIIITDSSGETSGLQYGDSSDLDEHNVRSRRDVEGSGIESNATCSLYGACFDDDDCNGGKCNGFALNTCNCGACNQFWICKTDSDCGGLEGACNNGFCDCYTAYTKHGYKDIFDAWAQLCNSKTCNKKTSRASSADCFGLPCNKGFCTC